MTVPAFNTAPIGPTSGGKVYAFNNIGTSPVTVAPQNNARIGIAFHNPGTITINVAPLQVQALNSVPSNIGVNPTGSISSANLTPAIGSLGGCFAITAGQTLPFSGECAGGWQALSASGSNNPLSVVDTNA